MDAIVRKIESQLAALPVPVAVQLPAGKRVGPPAAAVTLSFKDSQDTLTLVVEQGQVVALQRNGRSYRRR